eukprot:TRINITY_DN16412_c0_g1_i1.p1 TRINITY_DN16412_c0_g1~~TRINITY_DN16412_c0_g1_i1.p1  ORF type:complete len:206 (+),score=46.41 TRINITY_DN16412_c0_g1_i1:57-674(+)
MKQDKHRKPNRETGRVLDGEEEVVGQQFACLYNGCGMEFNSFKFMKLHVMQHRMKGERPTDEGDFSYNSEVPQEAPTKPAMNIDQARASVLLRAVWKSTLFLSSPLCCYCGKSIPPAAYPRHLKSCRRSLKQALLSSFLPPKKYLYPPPLTPFTADLSQHNKEALSLCKSTYIACSKCGATHQVRPAPYKSPFRLHEVKCKALLT